jgi:hypothetical protein
MKVECDVWEDTDEDTGQPCVIAECGRCGHTTQSFGTEEKSVKRCLALLREECPEGETGNFYVQADE